MPPHKALICSMHQAVAAVSFKTCAAEMQCLQRRPRPLLVQTPRWSDLHRQGICKAMNPACLTCLQVDAAGCASLSEADLAPLGTAALRRLDLSSCWRFEVRWTGACTSDTLLRRLCSAMHPCSVCVSSPTVIVVANRGGCWQPRNARSGGMQWGQLQVHTAVAASSPQRIGESQCTPPVMRIRYKVIRRIVIRMQEGRSPAAQGG